MENVEEETEAAVAEAIATEAAQHAPEVCLQSCVWGKGG